MFDAVVRSFVRFLLLVWVCGSVVCLSTDTEGEAFSRGC